MGLFKNNKAPPPAPAMDARLVLVHNEALKLRATAYNNTAISMFTVGILTPLAGVFTGVIKVDLVHDKESAIFVVCGMILYGMVAYSLRNTATKFLGGLLI